MVGFIITGGIVEKNGKHYGFHLFDETERECPVPLFWLYPVEGPNKIYCLEYDEWFKDIRKRENNLNWLIEYIFSKNNNISLEEAKARCKAIPDLQLIAMDDCMNNTHYRYINA